MMSYFIEACYFRPVRTAFWKKYKTIGHKLALGVSRIFCKIVYCTFLRDITVLYCILFSDAAATIKLCEWDLNADLAMKEIPWSFKVHRHENFKNIFVKITIIHQLDLCPHWSKTLILYFQFNPDLRCLNKLAVTEWTESSYQLSYAEWPPSLAVHTREFYVESRLTQQNRLRLAKPIV
jgi:hypothetical protein